MFYLMMHSLNLWLYGVRHRDHSDSERGNPFLPLYGPHFLISSKGSFISIKPLGQDSTYHNLCYGALAGM